MKIDDYFGRWMRVIDRNQLIPILNRLNAEYKRAPICPG